MSESNRRGSLPRIRPRRNAPHAAASTSSEQTRGVQSNDASMGGEEDPGAAVEVLGPDHGGEGAMAARRVGTARRR